MTDARTVDVYNANVARYRALVDKLPELESVAGFVSRLPAGAVVLDLGCGVGTSASEFRRHGLNPVCVDASQEMVNAANDAFDLGAKVASFADLDDIDTYDGVWANFSLLHASKSDFPHHIEAIYRALKPEGLFFIALKTGDGEKRDTLGRFYAYYQQEELTSILNDAGFKTDHIISGASRGMEGTVEPWIGIYAHKT